jgi:hypothetical protein
VGDPSADVLLADSVIDHIEIGHREFEVDDADIIERIDRSFVVTENLRVIEAAHHFHDRIAFADGRQELVAQALAFGGAFDQAGDIVEIEGGIDLALRLEHVGQKIEPLIGNEADPGVRIDGGERIILRQDVRIGNRVEQSGFAHVRKTDNTCF